MMMTEKGCMCFVNLENAFDRALKKLLRWMMRKKGQPE